MSRYTIYYNDRQQTYKELANAWKVWSTDVQLTAEQVKGMSLFFLHIGKRFGLINAFKEIGVI